MLVRDCMTPSPLTLGPDDSMHDALELMGLKRIRHLPVVDPSGRLLGLVTDRDLRRAAPSPLSGGNAGEAQAVLDNTPVERVMVRGPTSVAPAQPLKDAVSLMVDKKFGALPVVENGKLVGILSQIDVLRVFLKTLK